MNKPVASILLILTLFIGLAANADQITCSAPNAVSAKKSSIGTTGLYGLCMIDSCAQVAGIQYELYKNKCYAPAAPKWSLGARSVERGDYKMVAYAVLPRPAQGAKDYAVVGSGASSITDYSLPSSNIHFQDKATLSDPFEIQIKKPSGAVSAIDLNIHLGDEVMTVSLGELNQPKAILSLQANTTGKVVTLTATLSKVASKYFGSVVTVAITNNTIASAKIVIPKNSLSGTVDIGVEASGLASVVSVSKAISVVSATPASFTVAQAPVEIPLIFASLSGLIDANYWFFDPSSVRSDSGQTYAVLPDISVPGRFGLGVLDSNGTSFVLQHDSVLDSIVSVRQVEAISGKIIVFGYDDTYAYHAYIKAAVGGNWEEVPGLAYPLQTSAASGSILVVATQAGELISYDVLTKTVTPLAIPPNGQIGMYRGTGEVNSRSVWFLSMNGNDSYFTKLSPSGLITISGQTDTEGRSIVFNPNVSFPVGNDFMAQFEILDPITGIQSSGLYKVTEQGPQKLFDVQPGNEVNFTQVSEHVFTYQKTLDAAGSEKNYFFDLNKSLAGQSILPYSIVSPTYLYTSSTPEQKNYGIIVDFHEVTFHSFIGSSDLSYQFSGDVMSTRNIAGITYVVVGDSATNHPTSVFKMVVGSVQLEVSEITEPNLKAKLIQLANSSVSQDLTYIDGYAYSSTVEPDNIHYTIQRFKSK